MSAEGVTRGGAASSAAPAQRAGGPPAEAVDAFYRALRAVARFWVWFFFRRVSVHHLERVPARGPVLVCCNHPNNLIDSLVVGTALSRKVHYLATAALFRNPILARFLLSVGAIPVYRREDDPDKMDRNADAFAACHAAFDAAQVIVMYPEGTTHSEERVQRIKTGAARIALGYEAKRPGALAVIPAGLTFEARKAFRARVLLSFGPPVAVAPHAAAHPGHPGGAVEALTTAIQAGMEGQIALVDRIDAAALVHAVEQLYRGELMRELREARGIAEREVDVLRLSRSIAEAATYFRATEPDRLERLWQRVQAYRALLAEYRVRDDAVQSRMGHVRLSRRILTGWEAALGFPWFVYGGLVNALPFYGARWVARRTARKETDYATTRFLASIVAYPVFWGIETWLVGRLFGMSWALPFALTLPLSGLLASWYLVGVGRLRGQLRLGALSLRHRAAARTLVAERRALIAEFERAKDDYLAATRATRP